MVRQIVAEAKPVKVILFGSYARGSARPGSDVDLLVIERDPVAQRREAIRLRWAKAIIELSPASKDTADPEMPSQ